MIYGWSDRFKIWPGEWLLYMSCTLGKKLQILSTGKGSPPPSVCLLCMCKMPSNEHRLDHKLSMSTAKLLWKGKCLRQKKEASLCGTKPYPSFLLCTSFSTVSTFRSHNAEKLLTNVKQSKISFLKELENLHRNMHLCRLFSKKLFFHMHFSISMTIKRDKPKIQTFLYTIHNVYVSSFKKK